MRTSLVSTMVRFFKRRTNNPSQSINDVLYRKFKRYQLKRRAANACSDQTNYSLRLRNFIDNNKYNVQLITRAAGHMECLKKQGLGHQQASKETLELIQR